LLIFSKSITKEKSKTSVLSFRAWIETTFAFNTEVSIVFKSNVTAININKTAFEQMLINLVSNAIKYNDKEKRISILKY
jgi:signal transduction histidine kinase